MFSRDLIIFIIIVIILHVSVSFHPTEKTKGTASIG